MNKLPERFYTKTVYGLRLPAFNEVVKLTQQEDSFLKRHEKPWLKYQDDYHSDFSQAYLDWMKPIIASSLDDVAFYPSNGSSEAIKDTINYLSGKYTFLHLYAFEGEYEGYEAYAKCRGKMMNYIERKDWKKSIEKLIIPHGPSTSKVFFISEPSSVDGNRWKEFQACVDYLKANDWIVCVDLAYAPMVFSGAKRTGHSLSYVDETYSLYKLDLSKVDFTFISLSKTLGVYYNRVGGVFSRHEIPSLYGNQWFKNIDSLLIGQRLVEAFSLPKLKAWFDEVKTDAYLSYPPLDDTDLSFSDVPIIMNSTDTQTYSEFVRKGSSVARLCVSPMLHEAIERKSLK
jgi:hypothetical protein